MSFESNAAANTDALASFIEGKLQLLRQIHALTRRQLEIISQQRIDLLLQIFRAKAALLAEVQTIERKLDPYREQAPEQRQWSSPDARNRCRQQAAECESLLAEIKAWERQSEFDLTRERNQTAQKLENLEQAGAAQAAYSPAAPPAASQINLRM